MTRLPSDLTVLLVAIELRRQMVARIGVAHA
jgi:hypothetical protein